MSPRVEYGINWHGEPLRRRNFQLGVHKHVRPQHQIPIVDLKPEPQRPRGRVELGQRGGNLRAVNAALVTDPRFAARFDQCVFVFK